GSATALDVALDSAAAAALVCSDTTNVASTPTNRKITFSKGVADTKLAKDATITYTLTVGTAHIATGAAAITTPTVTVTAAN
ncbi:hypothetical protein, partial [Oscillibacter sp.]|uniref:hypothetical protein n=1 Tax=Oscillibacter sp. TaxID=1945593 RepID=UPI002D7FD310